MCSKATVKLKTSLLSSYFLTIVKQLNYYYFTDYRAQRNISRTYIFNKSWKYTYISLGNMEIYIYKP